MTDNDKEIVQALKNHIEAEDCVTCESFEKCNEFLLTENTLDLINRQQAEIDRLNAENMLTMSERNAFRNSFYEVSKQLKHAKSESIKEFAERLKENITNAIDTYYNSNGGGYYLAEDVIDDIDNLVK